MYITNYYESVERLPEDIDRTIKGVLKKEKRVLESQVRRGISFLDPLDPVRIQRIILLPDLSLKDMLKSPSPTDMCLEGVKSPWHKNVYDSYKDDIYYRKQGQKCICCGRISLKTEYCYRCEYNDMMQEFHQYLVKEDYEGAMAYYLEHIPYHLEIRR